MHDEYDQSLDGVHETEQPLHNLRGNVVTNDKETKSPGDAEDGKKDKGGV